MGTGNWVAALTLINTLGVGLRTTARDVYTERDRTLALRRCLRVYAKRRAWRVICGAATLQLVSLITFLRIIPLEGLAAAGLLGTFLIAAIGLGLYALDFVMDPYRALTHEKLN